MCYCFPLTKEETEARCQSSATVNKFGWRWSWDWSGIPVSVWNARVLSLGLRMVRGSGCAVTYTDLLAVQVTHGKEGASIRPLSQVQLNVMDSRDGSRESGRMGLQKPQPISKHRQSRVGEMETKEGGGKKLPCLPAN